MGYDYGAGGISLTYQDTEGDPDGSGGDDSAEIINAAIDYNVAEGLNTYISAYWFDLEADGGGTATTENEATVVIIGTTVSF